MALATYSDLQTSVLDWMERNDQTGKVADWITLGEARLNRELGPVETNASLTGVVDSRALDLSSLSLVEPISLFCAEPSSEDERPVKPISPAKMSYFDTSGRPSEWTLDTYASIKLNRPCDLAYAFRLRYRERFALSELVPTNWLLTNHPDVYLAATIVWGNGYNQDYSGAATWKVILDEAIPSIKSQLARSRKGELKVDPALTRRGGSITFAEWQNG